VLGLTYMRLFPQHIRSAILDSPISPQHLEQLDLLRGWTENLERVFAGCAANAACEARYPNIRSVFYDLVHELQAHPRLVSIPDFIPQPVTIRADGVDFYRFMMFSVFPGDLFSPEAIHFVLDSIWRSAHGELEDVYREDLGTGPITSDADSFVAEGKTMSYLCRDVVGFITEDDIIQAALDLPELAPYILDPGSGLPIGPAGCRIWDVGLADAAQHEPVSSRIPTLVLAGEYDTGVPAFIVRQIPPTLPNSFFYEFPASGHLQLADYNSVSSCSRSIADQFLRRPRRSPDASCVDELPQFDFTPPSVAAASRVGAWTGPRPAPSPKRASRQRSCGSPLATTGFRSRRCGTP
jgi:pimeloyl-ACP methyl ester carboxylesterase